MYYSQVSSMEPVYSPIICTAVTHPYKGVVNCNLKNKLLRYN